VIEHPAVTDMATPEFRGISKDLLATGLGRRQLAAGR
jgi:hypothetical protein